MKARFVGAVILVSMIALIVSGVPTHAASSDAWVPGLASFLIPGLGQLLNDQVDKAIVHFGVGVAISLGGSLASTALLYGNFYYGYYIVGAAYLAWSAYSGIDAYNVAKKQGFSLGMTQDGLTLAYDF
jgi:TM2 domain-containing membrane protein YozV